MVVRTKEAKEAEEVKELKIPRGVFSEIYVEKVNKGEYSIKIRNPNSKTPDDWFVEVMRTQADNQNDAKSEFRRRMKNDAEFNKKVREILNQLKEKDHRRAYERLKERVNTGTLDFYTLWNTPTVILRKLLQEEGFNTKGMTRDEMIEMVKSLAPDYREPVYQIGSRKIECRTDEGTIVEYEVQEYSDGSERKVKIKEVLPPDWKVYRNRDGIIDTVEKEIELLSGMWKIELLGLDTHPEVLKDRDYFVNEVKRIEYKLYSEGKDPTYITISGGRKAWENKVKEWVVKARLLPEVDSGGGLKPKPVIVG